MPHSGLTFLLCHTWGDYSRASLWIMDFAKLCWQAMSKKFVEIREKNVTKSESLYSRSILKAKKLQKMRKLLQKIYENKKFSIKYTQPKNE